MWKIEQKYLMFALLGACAGNQAEQVQDARMKQVEETSDARANAVENQGDQEKKAVDKSYDAERKAEEHSDVAGSEQSAKLTGLAKDRADYQTETQTKLDKIAVRIQEVQQKVNVLGGRAPTQLRTDVQTAATEHRTLQQELSNLERVQPQSWEPSKDRLEQRISQLQDRVSKIDDEIDDVKS